MNILDSRFKYRDSQHTNVQDTWKKHGYKPVTQAERDARQKRAQEPPANVHHIETQKRKAK